MTGKALRLKREQAGLSRAALCKVLIRCSEWLRQIEGRRMVTPPVCRGILAAIARLTEVRAVERRQREILVADLVLPRQRRSA